MSLCGILWRHHADSSFGSRPNLIIRGGNIVPKFGRAFLDEVIAKNDIVDVIAQYVRLERIKGNYFGWCPFHKGRSVTFFVLPKEQIYHCFTCGESGNVVNFIMKIEKLDYEDAMLFLANRAKINILDNNNIQKQVLGRQKMLRINKDAARYFYSTLWQEKSKKVQKYYTDRGLSRLIMNKFGLGYAPDSFDAMINALMEKGYSKEEMVEAGLACVSKHGSIYSRFRNRAMFPIINERGNVIGFGGRVLDDSKPKYLNSPETEVYHKTRSLFALNIAKKTSFDYFILAEGFMDVIALHQAGFDCAVASLGTALTDEQARIIARYTKRVIIAYDSDDAGKKAAKRVNMILAKVGIEAKILNISGAKDPDEFIKINGEEAFRNLLKLCTFSQAKAKGILPVQ